MLLNLLTILWIFAGVFAALPLILYATRLNNEPATHLVGRSLIVAALIYVLFAAVWGDIYSIGVEIVGLLIYSAFYFAPKNNRTLWIGIGWLLHTGWDIGLHILGPGNIYSPDWYVYVCLGFDVVIFIYCVYRWRANKTVYHQRGESRYNKAKNERSRYL